MKNNKKTLKAIVLSMVLAAGMLLPASSFAQEVEAETGGGMLGFGKLFGSDGQLFGNYDRGDLEMDLSIADFGEEDPNAPLGSGIAILIGASLGYVALKKKEDEQ